jgi:hypothetical protein
MSSHHASPAVIPGWVACRLDGCMFNVRNVKCTGGMRFLMPSVQDIWELLSALLLAPTLRLHPLNRIVDFTD